MLLNESAAKLLGFEDFNKVINEKFFSAGDTVTLVGIVNNYHHQGLQKAIDPMIFRLRPNARQAYSLKIKTSNVPATIASVQKPGTNFFLLTRSIIISLMISLISSIKRIRALGRSLDCSLFSLSSLLVLDYWVYRLIMFYNVQKK